MFNLTGHHKVDDQQRAFSVGNLPPVVIVFVLVWPNSFFVVMYSLVLLKIRGQDRATYFSAVLLMDWPRGVDARPSCPQCRASTEASGDSSDDNDDEDVGERTSDVHEKLWGKRLAIEEPSQKRKKTTGSSRREERQVNIGAPAHS